MVKVAYEELYEVHLPARTGKSQYPSAVTHVKSLELQIGVEP